MPAQTSGGLGAHRPPYLPPEDTEGSERSEHLFYIMIRDEEKILFHPYNALQHKDILGGRRWSRSNT